MSKESIIKEFEKYKGQFVITDDMDVKRLIAVGSDDMDYYWVYWDGRKTFWDTCVGGFVPLKGKIEDIEYDRFVRLAKLNHYDQFYLKKGYEENKTKQMIYDIMNRRMKDKFIYLKEGCEYMTDICWDIN